MTVELNIDMAKLSQVDFSIPYLTKEEVKKFFNLKSTAYDKYRNEFKEKISEKIYPYTSFIKIGSKEQIALYPWLHFSCNYGKFKDKRLAKYIEPYSRKTIQDFKDVGVGMK
ncbi:hypothetical protein ACWOBL_06035 [Gemella bergeri]